MLAVCMLASLTLFHLSSFLRRQERLTGRERERGGRGGGGDGQTDRQRQTDKQRQRQRETGNNTHRDRQRPMLLSLLWCYNRC